MQEQNGWGLRYSITNSCRTTPPNLLGYTLLSLPDCDFRLNSKQDV